MLMLCRKCPLSKEAENSPIGDLASRLWLLGNIPLLGRHQKNLNQISGQKNSYIDSVCRCYNGVGRVSEIEIYNCVCENLEKLIQRHKPWVIVAFGVMTANYFIGTNNIMEARKKNLYNPVERNFSIIVTLPPVDDMMYGTAINKDLELAGKAISVYKRHLKI
jgi:uracil-DNA glycosylase